MDGNIPALMPAVLQRSISYVGHLSAELAAALINPQGAEGSRHGAVMQTISENISLNWSYTSLPTLVECYHSGLGTSCLVP